MSREFLRVCWKLSVFRLALRKKAKSPTGPHRRRPSELWQAACESPATYMTRPRKIPALFFFSGGPPRHHSSGLLEPLRAAPGRFLHGPAVLGRLFALRRPQPWGPTLFCDFFGPFLALMVMEVYCDWSSLYVLHGQPGILQAQAPIVSTKSISMSAWCVHPSGFAPPARSSGGWETETHLLPSVLHPWCLQDTLLQYGASRSPAVWESPSSRSTGKSCAYQATPATRLARSQESFGTPGPCRAADSGRRSFNVRSPHHGLVRSRHPACGDSKALQASGRSA